MNRRTMLLENWDIKLVSLALALGLWFYVTSKGKLELTLTAPLELRNIPANMAVVGEVARNLEVRVQGQERVLRNITVGNRVVGIVDLSTATPGENAIHLSPDDIKLPAGVTITHIAPFEFTVTLERVIRKTLRLRPRLRGLPAEGYALAGTSVKPPKITVEGPASAVKSLAALYTMPIDVEGAKRDITLEPKIDYRGRPVNILEKNVTVRVFIERTAP